MLIFLILDSLLIHSFKIKNNFKNNSIYYIYEFKNFHLRQF